MQKRILYFSLCFLLGFFSRSYSNINNVIAIDDSTLVKLDKNSSVIYVEKNETINIENIDNLDWGVNKNGGNVGIVKNVIWFKSSFINKADNAIEKHLYFPFYLINEIDVYSSHNEKTVHVNSLGRLRDLNNNSKISGGWATKIVFESGRNDVYVRVNHLYLPTRVTSFLLEERKLDEIILHSVSIFWIWKSVFIFAMLISLVLFAMIRQKVFLFYFLFNLGILYTLSIEFGDYPYFVDDGNIIFIFQRFFNFLFIFFFPKFLNELIPIFEDFKKTVKTLKIGNYIFISFWISSFFEIIRMNEIYFYLTNYFLFYTVFVLLVSLFLISASVYKKRENSKILFGIYFIFIFFTVFDGYGYALGFVSDEFYIYETILFSSIFQVIAFLGFISFQLFTIYKDRNKLLLIQRDHDLEVAKAIVKSQESERNLIGRELHDMVGANMAVIKQKTDKANKLLLKIIDDTIISIRTLSHGLITPSFDYTKFEDEIKDLIYLFENDNMKIHYYFHECTNLNDRNINIHLYRIIQELLQNALKHSRATEVYLQFLKHEDNLTIMYEDNGVGFDTLNKKIFGRGLYNIEKRVSLIKANLQLDSSKTGTTVTIILDY